MKFFLGVILTLSCVIGGFYWSGGNLVNLWQPAEMLIILGAGVGMLIVGQPLFVVRSIFIQTSRQVFSGRLNKRDYSDMLKMMYEVLTAVRRQGMKKMEAHVENPRESDIFSKYPNLLKRRYFIQFVCDNLRLIGLCKISPSDLDDMLKMEIDSLHNRYSKTSQAVYSLGEAMPGFGILAAVAGIIIAMQHIDGSMDVIGMKVAAALVGTFIGIFMCYCLFDPLGNSLAASSDEQINQLESLRSMLVSHQKGVDTLIAIDSGRKVLESPLKPTFIEMEQMIMTAQAEEVSA